MKSAGLYRLILLVWVLIIAAAVPSFVRAMVRAADAGMVPLLLTAVCTMLVAAFWLNGVKDVVYATVFRLRKGTLLCTPRPRPDQRWRRVVLVYCTCNDFDGDSLRRSMSQTYPGVQTVILDDSTDVAARAAVDEFAAGIEVAVHRRVGRAGFKAGNLNSFLSRASFDYFVILDSDEIIPPDFVDRALDYFAARPDAGIVQATHVATRNRNPFMRMFAAGVDAHWPAYQAMKDRYGFLSLLGHGAMVSRACYEASGGFPPVVAEDLCFSIRARAAGFYTVFAPDIVCEEEYPVNYLAFKKRHAKWTQGNMEFIKKYSGDIVRAPMRWFEKLDIVLFTYSLPLTGLFFTYLAINLLVFPAIGYRLHYAPWLIAPTVVFLFAPMLNDVFTYVRHSSGRAMFNYLLHSMALYGSMFFTSLRASLTALIGESVFIVTPKTDERITPRRALRANAADIAFALAVLAVSLIFTRSVLPCLLITGSSLCGSYLTLMSNDRHRGRTTPKLLMSPHPCAAPGVVRRTVPIAARRGDTPQEAVI